MLYSGAGDGVYRTTDPLDGAASPADDPASEQVLASDRVARLQRVDALDGLLAAAEDDVYYSPDGETWTALSVPGDHAVTSVGASPDGSRLYVGTFPDHVYELAGVDPRETTPTADDWREVESFRELPRGDWHTPRHDDAAIVRDVHVHPARPERLVVAVEVGGVVVSEDGGEAWDARSEGLHDDVHTLTVVGPEEFVAATGDGCYHTTDAGRTWTDLAPADDERRYFREALVHDGDVYAGAAPGPSPTWPGGTDAALYVGRERGPLEEVASPRPEEVAIGWVVVDDTPIAATSLGTLLAERDDGFEVVGSVPLTDEARGRYVPLVWWPR